MRKLQSGEMGSNLAILAVVEHKLAWEPGVYWQMFNTWLSGRTSDRCDLYDLSHGLLFMTQTPYRGCFQADANLLEKSLKTSSGFLQGCLFKLTEARHKLEHSFFHGPKDLLSPLLCHASVEANLHLYKWEGKDMQMNSVKSSLHRPPCLKTETQSESIPV